MARLAASLVDDHRGIRARGGAGRLERSAAADMEEPVEASQTGIIGTLW